MRLYFLIFMAIVGISCAHQMDDCDIMGTWSLSGTMFENYEQAKPYASNLIEFRNDTIRLASGFFYLTEDLSNNFPKGKYPFVYYGKNEKFRMVGDSILIRSAPYKSWRSYRKTCVSRNEVILTGKTDTIHLTRVKSATRNAEACPIKHVSAYVTGGGNDAFAINFKVTYSIGGVLQYEELDSLGHPFSVKEFRVGPELFKEICSDILQIDFSRIEPIYHSDISESLVTRIEIEFQDGHMVRAELHNDNYPDELRLALINLLYYHQHMAYPDLVPVRY